MAQAAVAVDLGGTWIRAGRVSPAGAVMEAVRVPTPQTGPEAVADAIGELVRRLGPLPPGRVGVAVPGPLSVREGVVFEPPNLKGWRDVPLRGMLEERLGRPVVLENDANAAAVGEWWCGAGRGSRHLVYVTVSTGVGGGLVLDGRLYRGATDTAGEIGHVLVDPEGPVCSCGRRGHLEGIASGPAIARWVHERIREGRPSVLATGRPFSAREVAEAAEAGDALAREAFERAGRYLGWTVAGLLNLLNPEVVVIGGGVARAGRWLFDPLREAAREASFERPWQAARIVPAALGDRAGLVGAAYVAMEEGGISGG
ncbi:MAG: ROK family protein [Armatimonadota bacterium]|nr:ROK family protein [Armatimonadota bacterium]MDR5689007.1 ROK family protein [Armatimonadota bacterium]MDR7392138.1 ROK family protein [Armatimonadota bacterium]MDR7599352.1 ROK family protein [Armatimonadota bacterium]